MAIDMIEDNELGALAPSRLGSYQFADEAFWNYTGGDDFYNLLGSRKKKKEKFKSAIAQKLSDLPTDCQNIQKSIDVINNELQLLLKSKSSLETKTKIQEVNKILADFKKEQIIQDCDKKLLEAKTETERADTLKTLSDLSETSISKAQQELKGAAGVSGDGNTKKLLLYGGIGVAALVAIILILRK